MSQSFEQGEPFVGFLPISQFTDADRLILSNRGPAMSQTTLGVLAGPTAQIPPGAQSLSKEPADRGLNLFGPFVFGKVSTALVFVFDVLMKNASLQMLRQEPYSQLVERGSGRNDLLQNVEARAVCINHLLKSVDLSRDSRQPSSRVVL